MQRISLLLGIATALPACATDTVDTNTAAQANTLTKHESRRCDVDFCILHLEPDSDGDGIADVDEIAAESDPNDPLKYPSLVDLARLMGADKLPTFQMGNSLMVLLPTRDANGLPIFGGLLSSRKNGIETAGLEIPDSVDISRGFTMSRTVTSSAISFNSLISAFGRTESAMPVRLLADAIGINTNGDWEINSQVVVGDDGPGRAGGTLSGTTKSGDPVKGMWESGGSTTSFSVFAPNGSFNQSSSTTMDGAGNTTTNTSTTTLINSHTTTLGGVFATYKKVDTHNETSANKQHSVTTTTTTTTSTQPDGSSTSSKSSRTTVCDNGVCEVIKVVPASPPGDYPEPAGGSGYAYINPEAAEHSGVVTATPDGMRTAINELRAQIRVVPNDNDPLSNYEVPPTGVYDRYGPIALYGGDVEGLLSTYEGLTPAFIRVIQPDYDPNFQEQRPPMDAPPDQTCLYCYQGGQP